MSEYQVAAQVAWAVEAGGTVLINGATGAATTLDYPQAAIWDFLTRGESGERICSQLRVIAALDSAAAQALVLETVEALRQAGFLSPREANG